MNKLYDDTEHHIEELQKVIRTDFMKALSDILHELGNERNRVCLLRSMLTRVLEEPTNGRVLQQARQALGFLPGRGE